MQPRSDGVTLKDTFVNIRDTNEFVVNIATIGQADAVHRSAYEFDTAVDEFEALGLKKAPSETISAPRIDDAPISFECVVDRIIPMPPLPDHVVWGRVKRIHIRDDLYLPNGRIDVGALGVFGRLAGEYTHGRQHLHHTASRRTRRRTRRAPRESPRRARQRLLAHRHGRMVAVGLHEGGGEMSPSSDGFTVTRTPANTSGAPTLLLIHGFLDDASVWDGLVDCLGGEVASVRYDLPGFGTRSGSVADARVVTLESLAAEAGDILAGIDGPVIVVGQSLGTQVAELVAAQHPNTFADSYCSPPSR